jgi:hypothetical protein
MTSAQLEAGRLQRTEASASARVKARIIVPVWGEKYIARFGAACLPALLAPGNLPHLSQHFDCELVVITERHLFDAVRALEQVKRAQRWCALRLVAMDDVLSHPRYYGYTLTHCLYRGFVDLGDAARDVWCVFVNADFILADGSYRALAERMLAGERIVLAPSYCAVEERVRPALEARMAAENGILALPKREMAGLIIDHRHFTIRAKTINSRMYRIDHVDQLYYLADNDTLLGRQIPIAIVAFRPERVPAEPVAFWDYGVISEICPTSKLCVLGDSDDFLMMELRTHRTMAGWLKLGWMEKEEIARSLSLWMTEDQRRCGEHPLVVHRRELPRGHAAAERELDAYYRDVMQRVTSEPRDYRDHYIWTGALEGHQEWLQARRQSLKADAPAAAPARAREAAEAESLFATTLDFLRDVGRSLLRGSGSLYRPIFHLLRAVHLRVFGRLPDVRPFHPHYADLQPVLARVAELAKGSRRGLSIWTVPSAAIAPNLSRWVKDVANATPDEVAAAVPGAGEPYDFCFLELTRDEFAAFGALHARLRSRLRPGGHIVVLCRTRGIEQVPERDFQLIAGALPERDVAVLTFRGGFFGYVAQRVWDRALARAASGHAWDLIRLGLIAGLLAPVALLGNWRALRREPGRYTGFCTSLVLEIAVV